MESTIAARLREMLPTLHARLEDAQARHAQLTLFLRSKVVRTQWATSETYALAPFQIERESGVRRGHLLGREPKRRSNRPRYGFGPANEVLVADFFIDASGAGILTHYEEFWEHHPGSIDTTLYSYWGEKAPVNVQTLLIEDGSAIGFVRCAQHGWMFEHYDYSNGQIWRSHRVARERNARSAVYATDHYSYRRGALQRVIREWECGDCETIYDAGFLCRWKSRPTTRHEGALQ